jgi:hypothetical protein
MCVFLCVNPKVRENLEMRLARAHRQSMQLCALCPTESHLLPPLHGTWLVKTSVRPLDEAAVRRVTKRSAWLQVYCLRRMHTTSRHRSAQDWHKALNAIAEAWGRFLSLMGLHW